MIQEESNDISLPPKRDPSLSTDDPNTLTNAVDSRKFQAHGKGSYNGSSGKPRRFCTHMVIFVVTPYFY
jgi:hypothetical protein